MVYQTKEEALAFAAKELCLRREKVSFLVKRGLLEGGTLLPEILKLRRELAPCIRSVASRITDCVAYLRYDLTPVYTDILPGVVSAADSVSDLKRIMLQAMRMHRREVYLVCGAENEQEFCGYINNTVRLPEFINLYVHGVQIEVGKHPGSRVSTLLVRIIYSCTYREMCGRDALCQREAERIAAGIKAKYTTDWERGIAAVRHCVKEWRYSAECAYPGAQFTAWSAFKDGKAVCMGISLAVVKIFRELHIPCRYAFGKRNGVGHAWNLVYINGGWFYIDVTDAIVRRDPFFHWGMTELTDRTDESGFNYPLKCNCPKEFIQKGGRVNE